ncbi:hypothetical protein GOL85_13465 [Sinorhizobium medicae]|nr:hypothetical protein [Sinorhizobium medicae]
MSEKIEDGGYAFPVQSSTWDYKGITVRDWFAGQALPAAAAHAFRNIDEARRLSLLPEEWASRIAYGMADAMLAAGKGGA